MESGQSSNGGDIDSEFHLKCKIDCGEENSMKTSPNGKENAEGNTDISSCSSPPNENERVVSRPVLQSKTEKLPIEYEVNKPRISRPKFSNETDLEINDSLLQEFRSTLPETVSETKDNSLRISRPVIPDEGLSESEAILTKITSPVFPGEGSSDSQGNKAQISILEVSDGIGLGSKMGYLQISSTDKWKSLAKKDNASGNNTNSPLLSSLAIPSEGASESSPIISSVTIPSAGASESSPIQYSVTIPSTGASESSPILSSVTILSAGASESSPIQSSVTIPSEGDSDSSPLLSRIFEFHASRNDCLSLDENESFFKLPEKSTRNRSKTEWKKAVRRQIRYKLAHKDSQNIDDCQALSPLQTDNMPIKWKFSPFKKSDFADPEETSTETKDNLTLRTSLTVPDITTSESREQFSRERSLAVFDETGLENKFSSLQIANPVYPDEVSSKNNARLPQESSSLVFNGDLTNPDLHLRINRCVDAITSWITSYQESLSSFESSETSPTKRSPRKHKKAVRKQKRHQSPSKESEKEGNHYHAVSPTKTSEIGIGCEGYSPRISRPLVSDEAAPENKASQSHITQDLDEDTLWNLGILSSDCNSWLPKLEQRSSRSINATDRNEDRRNLEISKLHPESSLGDNLADLSIPSTSKVSPSAKSTQNSKSLDGEHSTNNPDNSKVTESFSQVEDSSLPFNRNSRDLRRNSRRNRSTLVSFRVGDNRIARFPVPNNPLRIARSDKEAEGGSVQNTSETKQ